MTDPSEALTRTPRTEDVIDAVMKRFPGETKAAQARYFEAVHQELAPLARELEVENGRLAQRVSELESQLSQALKTNSIWRARAKDAEDYLDERRM